MAAKKTPIALIAVHRLKLAKNKYLEPGETFDLTDEKLTAELVSSGAARPAEEALPVDADESEITEAAD